MVSYRHYTLQAARFDGITKPATPNANWSEAWAAGDLNNHVLNRYSNPAAAVGRFIPGFLGRRREAHSLVRVWTDGPIADGDGLTVLGSATTTEANPASVTRRALTPITASPETSTVIELAPFDDLGVKVVGDGGEDSVVTCHVSILDLSSSEAFDWFKNKDQENGEDGCCTFSSITVTGGAQQLAAWTGVRFIDATITTGAGVQDLTLPDGAGLEVGAKGVIVRNGGDPFRVMGDGAPINQADLADGIIFDADGLAVVFEWTGDSWTATYAIRDLAPQVVDDGDAPAEIPVFEGDKVFNLDLALNGPVLLPTAAEIAAGQQAILLNVGEQADLTAKAGNDLNGVTEGVVPLPNAGDTALLYRHGGAGYRVIRDTMGLAERPTVNVGTSVELTNGSSGKHHLVVDNADPATVTLTPSADTKIGCRYSIVGLQDTVTVQVEDAANDLIVGLGASVTSVLTGALTVREFEYIGTYNAKNRWLVTQ